MVCRSCEGGCSTKTILGAFLDRAEKDTIFQKIGGKSSNGK
jgi:hypothetical protein